MGIMEEIKGSIERLSDAERAELRAWLIERDHVDWDAQIASGQLTGKLNELIAEAKTDRAAGKARAL